MASVVESVWSPVIDATYSVGLIGYDNSAFVRLAAGTLFGAILLYIWKPSWAFYTAEGVTRPKKWSVTADKSGKDTHQEALTSVPWWLVAVGFGLAFALVV